MQKLKAGVKAKIHNRFDVEVVRGGETVQRAYAENIILDSLWTRLLANGIATNGGSAYFHSIHFGTGTGTLDASRTSLFSFLGYKQIGVYPVSNDSYTVNDEEGWVSLRRQVQLAENEYVGSTITEVGIAYGTKAAELVTHAMLRDMNGNQISIAKTDTDIINIYATVFVHWDPEGYDNGSIRMHANNTSEILFRYYFVGRFPSDYPLPYMCAAISPGVIGNGINYNISDSMFQGIRSISDSGNAALRKLTFTFPRVTVAQGNVENGIGAIAIGGRYHRSPNFYIVPSLSAGLGGSWFPGSTITGEAVGTGDGVTTEFATRFDLPENATVYVDGVSADVTVESVPLDYENMGKYFLYMESGGTGSSSAGVMPIRNTGYGEAVYYNPHYRHGISSLRRTATSGSVYCSDDRVSWTEVPTEYPAVAEIPEQLQNAKYWKLAAEGTSYTVIGEFTARDLDGKNIRFETPPAEGAVITADYTTKVIAKDSDHVFDFSLEITLGEQP